MGIYAIKPAFQRRLQSVCDVCVRLGVSADALTAAALVLSSLGAAALWQSEQRSWLLLLVPPLALGRIALNALDGMVATAAGTARPLGEVLNELGDRLSDAAWFSGLAFLVDARLALATLALVLVSSSLGISAKAAGGARVYAGIMAKADRMILLSLAALASFLAGPRLLTWATWVMAAGVAVTIVQRILAARQGLKS